MEHIHTLQYLALTIRIFESESTSPTKCYVGAPAPGAPMLPMPLFACYSMVLICASVCTYECRLYMTMIIRIDIKIYTHSIRGQITLS